MRNTNFGAVETQFKIGNFIFRIITGLVGLVILVTVVVQIIPIVTGVDALPEGWSERLGQFTALGFFGFLSFTCFRISVRRFKHAFKSNSTSSDQLLDDDLRE